MDAKLIFSARFRELFDASGLTQEQIAEKIGVTRATVGYYYNGQRTPDVNVLSRIAQYFGVTSDYLIGLSEAKQQENSDIVKKLGLTEKTIALLRRNMLDHYHQMRGGVYEYSGLDIMNRFLQNCLSFDLETGNGVFSSAAWLCQRLQQGIENPSLTRSMFDLELYAVAKDVKGDSRQSDELFALQQKAYELGCSVIGMGDDVTYCRMSVYDKLREALSKVLSELESEYKEVEKKDIAEASAEREVLNRIFSDGGDSDGDN